MKPEDKEKISIGGIVAVVIMILVVLFLVALAVSKDIQVGKNECLIDIAQSYCEEQGLVYSRVNWDMGINLFCKQNLRISNGELRFLFLEHEKEECLK